MNRTGLFTGFLVLALFAGGAYAYFARDVSTENPRVSSGQLQTYVNTDYGTSFQYPENYVVEGRNTGNGERERYTVTLMDRAAAENIPQNGEGPTAITVDIFQNDLDEQTPENWIKNNNNSNYKLSPDGVLTPTAVDGSPAFAYGWDGLYLGNSIVFSHSGNIVMLSVTFLTPDDVILGDFAVVVASMQLE
jgi:hypothetical protein